MSQWYRWDLHIHTPETQMNDNFKDQNGSQTDKELVWKKYCAELNNYGADVLGITDYFSAKNFFKLKRNRSNWGLNDNITLFPNVEIRVSDLVSKKREDSHKSTSYVNIHLIFRPDEQKECIEKFLRGLSISKSNGQNINFADDLEEIIKDNNFGYLPTTDSVKKSLRDTFGNNYKEKVLMMIPNSGDGINLKDGNGSSNGKDFVRGNIDFLQARTQNAYHDKLYALNPENNYKNIYASVTGCDAHSIEKIKDFPEASRTWIKAMKTFEGLKQITYEPDLRIKIQANKPEPPVKSKIIKTLELPSEKFGIKKLEFSDGLNTIIGGRSSGKSVLLSIISKLSSNVQHFKSDNSNYDNLINNLSENCVLKYADDTIPCGEEGVKFIYQDGLQEIARSDDKRNKFIEGTLYRITDISKIKEKIETYQRKKHDSIVLKINQFKELNIKIKEQTSKISSQQPIRTLEGNIDKLKKNIQVLQEQIEDIDQKSIDTMIQKIYDFESQIKDTQKDIDELSLILDNVEIQLNPQSQQYTRDVTKQVFEIFKSKIDKLNQDFAKYVDDRIQEKKLFIEDKNNLIQKSKKAPIYEQYTNLQEQSPELKKFQESLTKQQHSLRVVEDANNELKKLNSSRFALFNDLVNEIDFGDSLTTHDLYKVDDKNLNFQIISSINTDKFISLVQSNFKTGRGTFKNEIEAGIIDIDNPNSINAESIKKMMMQCLKLEINSINEDNPYRANLNLYSWFEQFSNMDFIQTKYNITYKGQEFHTMSEGKQAFILLMLQLSLDKDDRPFLIDQPEDELDNKAIYEELVSYLREQKQHRQLFIVTHNANVLVGGDSECVILAEEMTKEGIPGYQFCYRQGSIEDSNMQNAICEVLEGGEKAFKKREERYNFSRH